MNKFSLFNKISAKKGDNKGSVLVTVLVAFLFISVLVAIVLSTVSVNVRMRYIDSKTKDEFYYAEKALNDIYTGIGQDCSNYIGRKYNVVLNEYKNGTDHTYIDQEKAYEKFVQGFVTEFKNNYQTSTLETKFNNFIVKDTTLKGSSGDASRAMAKIDLSKSSILYYSDIERKPSDSILVSDLTTSGHKVRSIVIKNVSVESNPDANENIGYVSKITTDIVIDIPWIDFFNINKSGYDFAFAANAGLYIEEGANVTINGNTFAGTQNFVKITSAMNDSSEYGGININGGNLTIKNADYVISGGDINLLRKASTPANMTSTIKIEPNKKASNQIWFENLECKNIETDDPEDSANLLYDADISGNLFASGDLQVDGNFAKVAIDGSYYGYNNGSEQLSMKGSGKVLYTKESKYKVDTYNGIASPQVSGVNESISARSSSVIVNGKNDTVSFDNLKTMMIMGNAYINHESNEDKGIVVQDGGKITVGELPENVALKASQMLLYMPAEFLKVTNPVKYSIGESDPFTSAISDTISTSDWFGKDYIDTTNATSNHKIIKMKNNNTGNTYAYCYLNFKDDTVTIDVDGNPVEMSCKDAYVYKLIQGSDEGPEPTAATIKKRISDAIAVYNSKVVIDESTDSRIYSSSSIVEFADSDGDGKSDLRYVVDPDMNRMDILSDYSVNLYKRYRLMDTYFETLKNEPLSSNSVKEYKIDGNDFTQDGNQMPFARFFWLSGIRNAVDPGKCLSYSINGDKLVLIRATSGNEWDTIDLATVRDQNGNKVFEGKQNAIVLVDGPVCVGSGANVSINGFFASIDKVTVKQNATFNVSYDSGVVNRRIGAELSILRKVGGFHDGTDDVYMFDDDEILGIKSPDKAGVGDPKVKPGNPHDNLIAKQMLSYYLLRTDANSFNPSSRASNTYKLRNRGDQLKIPGSMNNITKAQIDAIKAKDTDSERLDSKVNNSGVITFYRMYQYDGKSVEEASSSINSDYTSFMYYDNWKKGQD